MVSAILIGGRSRRFGSDKVLVPFRGRTLVEHVAGILRRVSDRVVLVGHNRAGLEGFTVVEDLVPRFGPLGGIYTALTVLEEEHCFVCASDMPNIDPSFIKAMMEMSASYDIVMPIWSRGREPLHAVYGKAVLPQVEELIHAGEHRIFPLIQRARTRLVTEDTIRLFGDPETMFANVNTLGDLPPLAGEDTPG